MKRKGKKQYIEMMVMFHYNKMTWKLYALQNALNEMALSFEPWHAFERMCNISMLCQDDNTSEAVVRWALHFYTIIMTFNAIRKQIICYCRSIQVTSSQTNDEKKQYPR